MLNIILELLYCFIATLFFAKVMHAPKKSLIYSSMIAVVGFLVYDICTSYNYELMGYFTGTLIISLLGEICARKIKMPATIFIFPAVVPIVPGIGLYQTMLEFAQNKINEAIHLGVKTIFNIIAMAIAIALVSLIFSIKKSKKNNA